MQLYQPSITGSLSVSGSVITNGTITATTLVVQTVTSSVSYLTGSTQFGSLSSNTHIFTGSLYVSGALIAQNGTSVVIGSGTANYLPKFTGASTIGDSAISDNGTTLSFGRAATFSSSVTANGLTTVNNAASSPSLLIYGGNSTDPRTDSASGELRIGNNASYYGRVAYSNGGSTALYIDNSYDNAAASIVFRMRTLGSQVSALTILGSGNIGIGTSSPSYKLSVVNDSADWVGQYKNYGSNAYGLQIDLSGSTGATGGYVFGAYSQVGTGFFMRNHGGVTIGTANSYGNVKLYVRSSTQSNSEYAIYADNSIGDLFAVRNDGLFQTGNRANSPYNANISGRSAVIDASGTIGYTSSTRESKTNIKSIDDISWLTQLNPVSFNYRKKVDYTTYTDEFFDETAYGFIADEVEKVNKDFVFYNVKEDGTKKLAGVEYNHLIAVLVKGYQEQQEIINNLSAKVTALENK